MKIIVSINRVCYVYHPAAVDLSTGEIDQEKTVFMLNPYDEVAVEEALRIKDRVDSEIVLLALGHEDVEQSLRYAYAMGGSKIDRMVRIDYDHFDPWTSSLLFAQVIRQIGFDIVLCGKKITDNNASQMGPFLAELLDIPQVSNIVKLEFSQDKKTIVQRYLGKGDREEVECLLPALFTTELGLNDPRYPTAPNKILAKRMNIEVVDPQSLGIDVTEEEGMSPVKKFAPPRPKTRKVFTPDSNLSVSERLNMMMSGGAAKKGGTLLEGSPKESADQIVDFLIQNKILKEGA
jgi:electron transfer flavoprotein beta subunit